jgi:hypothetical protein
LTAQRNPGSLYEGGNAIPGFAALNGPLFVILRDRGPSP